MDCVEINTGTLALTETLECTPQGGGSNPYCHALREIEIEQGENNAIRHNYWTSNATQENIASRINQA